MKFVQGKFLMFWSFIFFFVCFILVVEVKIQLGTGTFQNYILSTKFEMSEWLVNKSWTMRSHDNSTNRIKTLVFAIVFMEKL